MAGQPKRAAALAQIAREGGGDVEAGWELVWDRVRSGELLKNIAATYGLSYGSFRQLIRKSKEWDSAFLLARKQSGEAQAEKGLEELLEADDHPAAVQRANSLANYRRWYAGTLDPEGFGDKKAPLVSISLGDLHLQALQAVKKLPPVGTVSLPSGADDSVQAEDADYEVIE